MALFEPIFRMLNDRQVRYVVVGGVAVVLRGHARFTGDLDLVGDQVFPMRDPDDPFRHVDLFVEDVGFEALWDRSDLLDLGLIKVRVASIEDLIRMKREAGRAQDLADIVALEEIARGGGATDA